MASIPQHSRMATYGIGGATDIDDFLTAVTGAPQTVGQDSSGHFAGLSTSTAVGYPVPTTSSQQFGGNGSACGLNFTVCYDDAELNELMNGSSAVPTTSSAGIRTRNQFLPTTAGLPATTEGLQFCATQGVVDTTQAQLLALAEQQGLLDAGHMETSPLSHCSNSSDGSLPTLERFGPQLTPPKVRGALSHGNRRSVGLAADKQQLASLGRYTGESPSPLNNRSISPSSSSSSGSSARRTSELVDMLRRQQAQIQQQQAIQAQLIQSFKSSPSSGLPELGEPRVTLPLEAMSGGIPTGCADGRVRNLVEEYSRGEHRVEEQQQIIDQLRIKLEVMEQQQKQQQLQQQQQQQQLQQQQLLQHQQQQLQQLQRQQQLEEQQRQHKARLMQQTIVPETGIHQQVANIVLPPLTETTSSSNTSPAMLNAAAVPQMSRRAASPEASAHPVPICMDETPVHLGTVDSGARPSADTVKPGARKRKAGASAGGRGPQPVDVDEGDMEELVDPLENQYQSLRWKAGDSNDWRHLASADFQDLGPLDFKMEADKGFLFSIIDDAFVCQKKNHFQITVLATLPRGTEYVATENGYSKLDHLLIAAYGVKIESPLANHIQLEQSTKADRKRYAFQPFRMEMAADNSAKTTIMRLHFSKTTENNGRKKGKPNIDQRYFSLVVKVLGRCQDGTDHVLASQVSERIIVRATNPSQFETDVEITWKKCQQTDSIYHVGRVGVNTEKPEEVLDVHGNLRVTGNIYKQSDKRVKENIEEVDAKQAVESMQKLKLYRYNYKPDYADAAGMGTDERTEVGVLAQELREVLPDAVKESGDVKLASGEKVEKLLVVNKDRLYMESVGAVQELCKVTDDLENRIHGLEDRRQKHLDQRKKAREGVGCMIGASGCVPIKFEQYTRTPSASGQPTGSAKSKEVKVECRDTEEGRSTVCTPRVMRLLIIALVTIILLSITGMVALYVLKDAPATTSNLYFYTVPVSNGSGPAGEPSSFTTSPTMVSREPASNSPLQPLCSNADALQDISVQNEIINCLPILESPIPDAEDVSQCCSPDFQNGFTFSPVILTQPTEKSAKPTPAYDKPTSPLPPPALTVSLQIPGQVPQPIKPGAPNSSVYYMVVRPSAGYDTVNLTLDFSQPYETSYCFPAVLRQTNCVLNTSATLQRVYSPLATSHVFELPISLSLEIWHGVRIYPQGSSGNCDSPDGDDGLTFWSYNFFFDHQCAVPQSQPPAAAAAPPAAAPRLPIQFKPGGGQAGSPEAAADDPAPQGNGLR